MFFPPHLCLGFLFLVVHSRRPLRRPPPPACSHTAHTQLIHTQLVHTQNLHTTCPHITCHHTTCPHTTCLHTTYTYIQLVHTQLTHIQLVYTQLVHTQLVTTQLVHTHNLLTHTQLFHSQLPHIRLVTTQLVQTQLPHTQLTHIQLVTTQLVHTQLTVLTHNLHIQLVTTTCPYTTLRGTWWHRPSLCVAGVTLMALDWLWWCAWVSVGRRCRRDCWHGRRGTWWHRPSLCVAGVALGDLYRCFAWQAWHFRHWTGSGGALGSPLDAVVAAAVGVAGVALGDIDRHFAWQAWHLATSTVALRGRRGTLGTGLALVARLGLRWTPLSPWLWAWQAWHLVTSTVTLRGRPGTCNISCFVLFCQVPISSRMCCRCSFRSRQGHFHDGRHVANIHEILTIFFAFLLVSFDLSCGQVPFRLHHAHAAASTSKKAILRACGQQVRCSTFRYIHTYIFTYIHTCIHTYHLFTHHLSLSHTIFHIPLCHTQLFLLLDPSPPPLSFLPSPSRYNICCSLLEEVDMWVYPSPLKFPYREWTYSSDPHFLARNFPPSQFPYISWGKSKRSFIILYVAVPDHFLER